MDFDFIASGGNECRGQADPCHLTVICVVYSLNPCKEHGLPYIWRNFQVFCLCGEKRRAGHPGRVSKRLLFFPHYNCKGHSVPPLNMPYFSCGREMTIPSTSPLSGWGSSGICPGETDLRFQGETSRCVSKCTRVSRLVCCFMKFHVPQPSSEAQSRDVSRVSWSPGKV